MTSEQTTAPTVGSVIAEAVGDALLLRTADEDPEPLIRLTAALPVEPDRVTVLGTAAVSALPELFPLLPEILGEHLGGSAAGIRLLTLGAYAGPLSVERLVRDLADRIGQEIIVPLEPCTVDESRPTPTLTGGRAWLGCVPGGQPYPEPEWPARPPAPIPDAGGGADADSDGAAVGGGVASEDAYRRAGVGADGSLVWRPGAGQLTGSTTPATCRTAAADAGPLRRNRPPPVRRQSRPRTTAAPRTTVVPQATAVPGAHWPVRTGRFPDGPHRPAGRSCPSTRRRSVCRSPPATWSRSRSVRPVSGWPVVRCRRPGWRR